MTTRTIDRTCEPECAGHGSQVVRKNVNDSNIVNHCTTHSAVFLLFAKIGTRDPGISEFSPEQKNWWFNWCSGSPH
ncbi:MAG: hypothetical protein H6851_07590 [Geminicoccaceae bacterium]|nr:hypothetical protein [Geminicoccaceae bacterium]